MPLQDVDHPSQLSLMLEKHLQALEAAGAKGDDLEDKALELALEEMQEGDWKPWARNAKSIRIGEIILLVDSDTVVPEVSSVRIARWLATWCSYCIIKDCLRDAARELAECPEVAIIQHESG
jgi:hypothetical protein